MFNCRAEVAQQRSARVCRLLATRCVPTVALSACGGSEGDEGEGEGQETSRDIEPEGQERAGMTSSAGG